MNKSGSRQPQARRKEVLSVSVHICGGPQHGYPDWANELLEQHGLEGWWHIEAILANDEAERVYELEQDLQYEMATVCGACAGTAEHACPDLEFETHDEAACRYGCMEGEVSCACRGEVST